VWQVDEGNASVEEWWDAEERKNMSILFKIAKEQCL
jgi:hypothetical protein